MSVLITSEIVVMCPPAPSLDRARPDGKRSWPGTGRARRAYPWRSRRPDPYAVLVSEVMLQQTQASRVVPAFEAFMERFPTVDALATAPLADVIRAWGGLGYPRRAAALHAAALVVEGEHGGQVPSEPVALRRLPGVGEYTAAAVASLGYGRPVAAVDTNVRRIWLVPCTASIQTTSQRHDSGRTRRLGSIRDDPASWNQALMDLGRTVCRPAPRCELCPMGTWCRFAASGRRGRPSSRRQAPFEGSLRQVRGAVLASLRQRSPLTVTGVTTATGFEPDRVVEAIQGLARDGVVDATEAALQGRPRARVSLPR